MTKWTEVQCDGLVGPTHNYAGLSHGNIASETHAASVSNPRKAALQGLEKMRYVASRGIPQVILPPHPRPNLSLLEALGFHGTLADMLQSAAEQYPLALAQAYSAAHMWTANAATVSPSPDSQDSKLHVTVANLASTVHRQQEASYNRRLLATIFSNAAYIHEALPACVPLTDEGAANHMRLCASHGDAGVEVFVYGQIAGDCDKPRPQRYPARQTLQSVQALARKHRLTEERVVFVQQQPKAIDDGVFHNDVIAMSNETLLIYHEAAFVEEQAFLDELRGKLQPVELQAIRITEEELPLEQAVKSYFFNSQLLSLPEGGMAIIAPRECEEITQANAALDRLVAKNDCPVQEVKYLDVRESMKNGGGPACLRLRVVMSDTEFARINPSFLYSEALHERLEHWVKEHYREKVTMQDLQDPKFAEEALAAFSTLQAILPIPE
jgi:succinylarginine dihydrolase